MKKLFRLLIAVFCIFFALRVLPASSQAVLRSFFQKTVEAAGEFTLILSEGIDNLAEYARSLAGADQDSQGNGTSGGEPGDTKTADAETESTETADGGGDESFSEEGEADGDGISSEDKETVDESASSKDAEANDEDGSSKDAEVNDEDGSSKDAEANNEIASAEDGEQDGEDNASGDAEGQAEAAGDTAPVVRGPVSDEDIVYFYYTQISTEERLLYDAMLALAQNQYNDGSAEESRLVEIDPASEEFSISYTRAFNALINDHPELFWVGMSKAVYQCRYYVIPAFGGKYKIIFTLAFPDAVSDGSGLSGADYRNQYTAEQEQLRTAADAILAQVDFSQSDPVIALQLHDLLINSAWYNRDAGFDDYAHTAYGALVADSSGNPGGALCDGYALAYVYLLQRAGLTTAMISGYAGSSEDDLEKHAWNIVSLDNEWYEVDATWDDLDFEVSPSEEGYNLLMEALSDEYYMARIRHYMFNRTTEEFRSFTPGEEYRYSSDSGWVSLLRPSVHIRFTEEDSAGTRDYITPLAPVATGTLYTWEMLSGQQ